MKSKKFQRRLITINFSNKVTLYHVITIDILLIL